MLKSIISPKIGLVMIRKQLEKQLEKEIKEFEIIYRNDTQDILFIIDSKAFPFEHEVLKKMLKDQTAGTLKDGEQLDIVKLKCTEANEILCAIFFRDKNDEKKFLNTKL